LLTRNSCYTYGYRKAWSRAGSGKRPQRYSFSASVATHKAGQPGFWWGLHIQDRCGLSWWMH